ncbi:MAG: hypothetical protein ACJ73N_11565 [Bryobacteraceae bacterium]
MLSEQQHLADAVLFNGSVTRGSSPEWQLSMDGDDQFAISYSLGHI